MVGVCSGAAGVVGRLRIAAKDSEKGGLGRNDGDLATAISFEPAVNIT